MPLMPSGSASPSNRCCVTTRFGSKLRSPRRSSRGLRSWSNSGPISSRSCSFAPVAKSRTFFTLFASQDAASGSRSGPRMKRPAMMRTRISPHPTLSNTVYLRSETTRSGYPSRPALRQAERGNSVGSQGYVDDEARAVADQLHRDDLADVVSPHRDRHLGGVPHQAATDLRDDVALLDAGVRGRAAGRDVLHLGTHGGRAGDGRRGIDADVGVLDLAVLDQRLRDLDRVVAGDREADADAAAVRAGGADRGVDPDERAGGVDERATGV